MYSIDQARYQGQYQENIAELAAAQARYAQAQKNAERYQNLWDNQAIEAIVLEQILLEEKLTQSELAMNVAKTTRAQANLRYALICAPFDGYLTGSYVKVGDLVIPQQTTLATLVQPALMQADIFINEKTYFDFFTAMDAATAKHFVFTLVLPSGQPYALPGRFNFMDPIIDPLTGTLRLQVLFDNPQGLLKAGMNAVVQAELAPEHQKNGLLVPTTAIFSLLNAHFVFVVNTENRVESRKVRLGNALQGGQIILEGLQLGDQIIIENTGKIQEGMLVQSYVE